jgi:hypothetical protein
MKISKLALIALLGGALMAFGCSDDTSGEAGSGGSGGTAGTGGTAGDGGTGGAAPACVASEAECSNGAIDATDENCEVALPTPPDVDTCVGTESIENPATCTALDAAVTVTISQLAITGDCNSGYNLDSCTGNSCVLGGLAPGEGADGVDNALAGLAPVLVGVGGNLGGVNQAFYDGLCTGDIAIAFAIDPNTEENCAVVDVLDAEGAVDRTINMNLSADGCLSGTIGQIPLNVAGIPGQMNNAVLRASLSEGGISNGQLGATVDQATAGSIADELIDGGSAVVSQVLDINDDLSGDTGAGCDALSMTLTVGCVTEEAPQ